MPPDIEFRAPRGLSALAEFRIFRLGVQNTKDFRVGLVQRSPTIYDSTGLGVGLRCCLCPTLPLKPEEPEFPAQPRATPTKGVLATHFSRSTTGFGERLSGDENGNRHRNESWWPPNGDTVCRGASPRFHQPKHGTRGPLTTHDPLKCIGGVRLQRSPPTAD
jgi:hypothetical protein